MKKINLLCVALLCGLIFSACSKKTVIINSAQDLAGKKIGVQSGTTGELYVQEEVKDAVLSSFRNGIDAALDLKNGAIDAVVLDELPAKEIVARNPDLEIVKDRFAKEEYAIAVKKGNAELLDKINQTITEMKSNGDYEKLVAAFMPVDGNIVIPNSIESNASKVIKLGTNAAFPPFEYVEGVQIVGFDISMGEKIAETCGKKLEVVNMEFDSLVAALQTGTIDFIAAGMSVTEERKKNVDFSVPYFSSEQVIIVKKNK